MSFFSLKSRTHWYVYELADPRDGLAFYVGKGKKDRIAAHEREAEKAEGVCSEKINKIKEIWAAGLQVERRYVAWFWDEQAAYDFEAAHVDVYGLEALTNIIPGGGSCRGSYIQRPVEPKPWTAEIAAKQIIASENLLSWFCQWLIASDKGGEYEISGNKWSVTFGVAAFKMFPDIWAKIRESRAAVELVEPHAARHGVRFDYGGA